MSVWGLEGKTMANRARVLIAMAPVSKGKRPDEAESLEFTPLRSYGAPDLPRRLEEPRYARLETHSLQSARN